MMILANEVAAAFAMRYKVPIPFRTQQPSSATPTAPAGNSTENSNNNTNNGSQHPLVLAWDKIKVSTPATYSAVATKHHGVGLFYTRATSPIRRYCDILTHFQVKSQLKGETLPFSEKEVNSFIPQIQERELEIKTLQRNSERFWVFQYLQQQGVNAEYNGVVLQMKRRDDGQLFADLFLVDVGLKVAVRLFQEVAQGSKMRVRLVRADSYGIQLVPSTILDFLAPQHASMTTPTGTAHVRVATATV
jgi:exoribonuclease-2